MRSGNCDDSHAKSDRAKRPRGCGLRSVSAAGGVNLSDYTKLIRSLETNPRRLQAHYGELESGIAWCMDEVFRLATTGEDDARKTRIVLLEKQARELLERWQLLNVN